MQPAHPLSKRAETLNKSVEAHNTCAAQLVLPWKKSDTVALLDAIQFRLQQIRLDTTNIPFSFSLISEVMESRSGYRGPHLPDHYYALRFRKICQGNVNPKITQRALQLQFEMVLAL